MLHDQFWIATSEVFDDNLQRCDLFRCVAKSIHITDAVRRVVFRHFARVDKHTSFRGISRRKCDECDDVALLIVGKHGANFAVIRSVPSVSGSTKSVMRASLQAS